MPIFRRIIILLFFIQIWIPEASRARQAKSLPEIEFKDGKNAKKFWDSISFSLFYSVQSDFASELKPRLYSHLISNTLTYNINKNYSLSLSSSFYYISLDEKILLKKDTYGFNDLVTSISRYLDLGKFLSAKNSSIFGLSSSFPISEKARLEGYKAIPRIYFSLTSSFFDSKYKMNNTFSYRYTINTYEYSPSTRVANTRDAFSYSMNHYIKIIKNLTFVLGFGIQYKKNTQGESTYSYNNTQSIKYALSKLFFGLSYQNGGFTDDGDIDFWYVDRYRRNLKAVLGYSF